MLNVIMLPLNIQSKWEKEVHTDIVIEDGLTKGAGSRRVEYPPTPPFPVSTLMNKKNG
jgi:hypothetical protein